MKKTIVTIFAVAFIAMAVFNAAAKVAEDSADANIPVQSDGSMPEDQVMEQMEHAVDPAAWEEIKIKAKVCSSGWSLLSGAVRGKNIVTTLTDKQREVAKLASFGMSNKEIATKLDMSLAGVKQALLAVSDKLGGVSRDNFAAYL